MYIVSYQDFCSLGTTLTTDLSRCRVNWNTGRGKLNVLFHQILLLNETTSSFAQSYWFRFRIDLM